MRKRKPCQNNILTATGHRALQAVGYAGNAADDAAVGLIAKTLNQQAAIQAYSGVFLFSALFAFVIATFGISVPFRNCWGADRPSLIALPSGVGAASG